MNPKLKNILIPGLSAVLGGLVVLSVVKMSPGFRQWVDGKRPQKRNIETQYDDIFNKQESIRNQFDSIFNDDFFGSSDPFERMRKMRESMSRRKSLSVPKAHNQNNIFDSWFSDRFGGGSISDISQREDENSVYYDLKIENLNGTSIDTKIENGYVIIKGTIEKKISSETSEKDGFNSRGFFKSTFNRSFPIPESVDESKMEITSHGDKIVLRFPKKKT